MKPFVSSASLTSFTSLALLALLSSCQHSRINKPNVLFISLDDMNDWIEPLGGHPQALTPNLSRLAEEGMIFRHAYCASPSCNPSRTALLTGKAAYRTGMYSNYQVWREVLPDVQTMPQYFHEQGYWAAGAGKIFHNNMPDPQSWDDYFPSKTKHMPDYYRPKPGGTVNMPVFHNMYLAFDWSPIPLTDEQTGDYQSVHWVTEQLKQPHTQPFFLACGIYRPHLPWYVPQKYFDKFPLDSVQLPKVLDHDLDDLSERAHEIAHRSGNYHQHVIEAGLWKNAVQGYLASINFSDMLVGKLLDALAESDFADNTIVVLWSDHGWQLGEKEHWRKFALWDNVIHSVLMFRVPKRVPGLPRGTIAGEPCDRIVSLLDIFPTLTELCGLPPKSDLSGRSLVPLLKDPGRTWNYPAISTYHWGEFSIRTENWHYIKYIDDSEELYDIQRDPEEWYNLAGNPAYRNTLLVLKAFIPEHPAALVKTSYKVEPHHWPPFRSKEEYLKWKKTGVREWD